MPDSFQLPDFYPRPPRGGRRDLLALSNSADLFLSTPSARRATRWILLRLRCSRISIHALREEGDHLRVLQAQDQTISIHALREEGDQDHRQVGSSDFISIHALREEGDDSTVGVGRQVEISIHALREEGDKRSASSRSCGAYFYPRPPRGGRPSSETIQPAQANFYPRPPRGGRRDAGGDNAVSSLFLSTPSARRATVWPSMETAQAYAFLSTPSARRATFQGWCYTELAYISIHALREEGDLCSRIRNQKDIHFYPRPPRGGRHVVVPLVFDLDGFLSTPSARRATPENVVISKMPEISIHALREEGDCRR